MSQRVSYYEIAPDGMEMMIGMEKYNRDSDRTKTS